MRNAKLYVTAAAVCAASVVGPAAISGASAGSPLDFIRHLIGGVPRSVPVSVPATPSIPRPVINPRPISIPQIHPISVPIVIPDVHHIIDKLPSWHGTTPTTWGPKDPTSATTEQSSAEGCVEACG